MARAKKEITTQPVEQMLWAIADKLRKNMDAAEYKLIVLALIFLEYISDNFYELCHKLEAQAAEGITLDERFRANLAKVEVAVDER